jgi:signal transduction histidine kinase
VPRSVRARVTIGATATVFVVLTALAVALVAQQRRVLTETLDEALQTQATSLLADDVAAVIPPFVDDDAVARVLVDGEIVAATRNDGDIDAFRTVTREDGDRTVVVAAPTDDIDESVTTLVRTLAVAVPIATAVLGILVWVLVGRTLRPVEAIRAEVASIGGRDLHRRVPVAPTGDEIERLAVTMNRMLDRVEDSSARQAQFVADASHELRTPLARMRAELEVDVAHPATADPLATHTSVLEEVDALQHLVDGLLARARADAGAARAEDDVDLASLVEGDEVVHVDATTSTVRGDRRELARAIGNLVDNARRHARTRVDVVVRDSTVAVSDDGPGVPADERDRIFDRFVQVDESRHQSGAGLGLAIARAIAERHGGTLVLEGANRFVLRLPPAAPRPPR